MIISDEKMMSDRDRKTEAVQEWIFYDLGAPGESQKRPKSRSGAVRKLSQNLVSKVSKKSTGALGCCKGWRYARGP